MIFKNLIEYDVDVIPTECANFEKRSIMFERCATSWASFVRVTASHCTWANAWDGMIGCLTKCFLCETVVERQTEQVSTIFWTFSLIPGIKIGSSSFSSSSPKLAISERIASRFLCPVKKILHENYKCHTEISNKSKTKWYSRDKGIT